MRLQTKQQFNSGDSGSRSSSSSHYKKRKLKQMIMIPNNVQQSFNDLKLLIQPPNPPEESQIIFVSDTVKLSQCCSQLKVMLEHGYKIIDHVLLNNNSQESLVNMMKGHILQLENLMYNVGNYVLFPDRNDERHMVENNIDFYEQVLDNTLTHHERQAIVYERFEIRKPSVNLQDCVYPLQEQKTKRQNQQATQQKAQKQLKKKLNLTQRGSTKNKVLPDSAENNFVQDNINSNRDLDQLDEGRPQKKIKTDANVKSHPVTQIIREQKRTQLLEILKKNPTFMNRGEKQLESKVQDIEKQEFGDHHQNKNRYIKRFDKLFELLVNLQDCSHLSERLYKKNFSQNNVELMLNWVKDDKIKEKEIQLREVQIKKRETDLKQKPQTPYDPLSIKPIQPVIKQRKIPPPPLQTLNKILEKRGQKLTKPISADDEPIISQILNQNEQIKPMQQQEKPQPIVRAQKHRAFPSPKRRQSSNSRGSSSSHQKRRKPKSKKVKHHSKKADDYRSSCCSQSSDLPDFAEKGTVKSITKSVAILYDPDREEQDVPVLVPKQTISLIFGAQVHKIGRSKLIRDKDSSLRLEFYTQELQHKFKEIPQIANELKMKQYQIQSLMTYIDTKIDHPQFRMIVGWVYPERFKELGQVNRLAKNYKKNKHVGIYYHNNTTNFILAHKDQIQDSKLFSAFKPYDNFVPKNKFRKDDGIIKYWGKLQSNLIFILYVKDAAASQLSDFKPINVETIEMMENMDEVKLWVDKRKDELRREDSKKRTEKNHFTNNNNSKEKVEKKQFVNLSDPREISEPKLFVQQTRISQQSQHDEKQIYLGQVSSEEDGQIFNEGFDSLMRQNLNIQSQFRSNAQRQQECFGTAYAQNDLFPQQLFRQQLLPQQLLPQNNQYQQRYPSQQYQNPAEKK